MASPDASLPYYKGSRKAWGAEVKEPQEGRGSAPTNWNSTSALIFETLKARGLWCLHVTPTPLYLLEKATLPVFEASPPAGQEHLLLPSEACGLGLWRSGKTGRDPVCAPCPLCLQPCLPAPIPIIPAFQMRLWRLRVLAWCAQGHPA